jgi:DNA-binding FadR family transcriptional regulator
MSPRLVDGDTEFHLEVARATGNPVLALMSQTIVALLREERLDRGDLNASLPVAFAGHREIVDAIEDGDGDRAALAMTNHLALVSPRRAGNGNGAARAAS